MMGRPAIWTITLTALFVTILAGLHQEGEGLSPDQVKAAVCDEFKCFEGYGMCYGYTEFCSSVSLMPVSCFPSGEDRWEWCQSGKPPIHPQCKYACVEEFGLDVTREHSSAPQKSPAESGEPNSCNCPLYSCKNSTGTECYGYDSYCSPAGIVKPCFPEMLRRDDRLKRCHLNATFPSAQCKYACHNELEETAASSDTTLHVVYSVVLVVLFIAFVTVVICLRCRYKPKTSTEGYERVNPQEDPHADTVIRTGGGNAGTQKGPGNTQNLNSTENTGNQNSTENINNPLGVELRDGSASSTARTETQV